MITTLILITLAALVGFAAGFIAGAKNANSKKLAAIKAAADTFNNRG